MDADFAAQIAANQVRVATGRRNRVIGYAVFCPDKDAMHLESLAVRPSAAGQGVGKALMDLCEVEARALGLKAVRLYTNAAMIRNLQIYRHLGYVETHRRFQAGFDRVYFEKRLT